MGIGYGGLAAGAGLAQGLVEGVKLYYQTQNMLAEQAIKKKLANAQSLDAISRYKGVSSRSDTQNMAEQTGLLPPSNNSSPSGLLDSNQSQVPQNTLQPSQGSPGNTQSPSLGTNIDLGYSLAQDRTDQQNQNQQQGIAAASQGGTFQPNQGFSQIPDYETLMDMAPQDRALYAPAIEAQIKSNAELRTLPGMAAYKKNLEDLKNASLEQFNRGAAEFKPISETFSNASDAYGKLIKVTNDKSPKNLQSALMQVIKLDMPKQAVRFSALAQMEQDPQIMERWGNQISELQSGHPSDISVRDLQRLGTNLFQSNLESFRADQQDAIRSANRRGVSNPTYVQNSYADKMEKISNKMKNSLGAYEPPTAKSVASQFAPDWLKSGIKGLLPNPVPNAQAALYGPHPQDQEAINFAKQNPKNPMSKQILKLNGVQ